MKKGFTLLELIIVIIIIGVLATLGFAQYQRMVERSRGAEGRAVLGSLRTMAIGYYTENRSILGFNNTWAGIGTSEEQIPNLCRVSHYFNYSIATTVNQMTATARRCTAGGKNPQSTNPFTLSLTTNVSTGNDTWGGTGGY